MNEWVRSWSECFQFTVSSFCAFLLLWECTLVFVVVLAVFSGNKLHMWLCSISMPLGQPHSTSEGWSSVCCVLVCPKKWHSCQCLGSLTCPQMLIHAIAYRGCTNAITKSALKFDPGRRWNFFLWLVTWCFLMTQLAKWFPRHILAAVKGCRRDKQNILTVTGLRGMKQWKRESTDRSKTHSTSQVPFQLHFT